MHEAVRGARLAARRLVWTLNSVAMATGWVFVGVFFLSGLSIEIAGWLLGDFFMHLASAPGDARGAFLGVIAIPSLALIGFAAWSRRASWPTEATIERERDAVHS